MQVKKWRELLIVRCKTSEPPQPFTTYITYCHIPRNKTLCLSFSWSPSCKSRLMNYGVMLQEFRSVITKKIIVTLTTVTLKPHRWVLKLRKTEWQTSNLGRITHAPLARIMLVSCTYHARFMHVSCSYHARIMPHEKNKITVNVSHVKSYQKITPQHTNNVIC